MSDCCNCCCLSDNEKTTRTKRMQNNALFGDAFGKSKYWTLEDLANAASNPTEIRKHSQVPNKSSSSVQRTKPTEVATAAQTAILQLRCDCVKLAVSGNPAANQQQQWLGKMRQVCEFLCAAANASTTASTTASKDVESNTNGTNKEEPILSHSDLELLMGEASKAINAFSGLAD